MKNQKGERERAINKIDSTSGITLVALVITIILLLILAAVTINLALGDNGLIKTAKDASKNYVNAANNEDEQISEFINIMNNIISGGTGEEGVGSPTQNKVSISEAVWNENTHIASVTISKSAGTESGIQMQYQINSETGVWTTVGTQNITISDLKHNDVVYARLLKENEVVNSARKNIKDAIPPEVGITITNIGSNSMTASVTAQDKQYGMPTNPTYTFEIKETGEADSQYTQRQTLTTTKCSFSGLTKETSYTVRVTTSDRAGNSKSVTITKSTNSVEVATGNINFGTAEWDASTHTASINITTETGLQIQYKTSGSPTEETGWSTPGISPVTASNLTNNQTIYARLWDGNNAGNYASYTIKDSIDPQDAQISSWETTDITVATSATVKLLLIDNESGVNVGNSKWTLHTSPDSIGTSASDYDNTFTGTSTEHEITISKQETGTYYLHVLTVDNAGRTKETVFTEKAITVRKLVTEITLSSETNEVSVGEKITITVTTIPSDASNTSVTWGSSDTTIVTVDENGEVTGVKEGIATITATAADGSGVSGSYVVTVRAQSVPITSVVNVGDYIEYNGGNEYTGLWRVLYNDSTYGLQIVSDRSVGKFTIGSGYESTAIDSFNNAVNDLNALCEEYVNPVYAVKGRCVGSDPLNPEDDVEEYYFTSTGIETAMKALKRNGDFEIDKSRLDYYRYELGGRMVRSP